VRTSVVDIVDLEADASNSTVDDAFGGLIEREGKYAKRVVYAVHRM